MEDLNLSVFNMITEINESQTLTKHISYKCRFNGRKCNSDQWWNNDIFGILLHVIVKIENI